MWITAASGGGLPVSLCDYLFPGDTCADACQSAKELLGLRIRKEHVDDSQETLAGRDSGCHLLGFFSQGKSVGNGGGERYLEE